MRLSRLLLATGLAMLVQIALPPIWASFGLFLDAAAAQDDDDDGDDDDDDDDNGGGSFGFSGGSDDDGGIFRQTRRQTRPASAAAPLPVAAPDEIVVLDLPDASRDALIAEGFVLIREDGLAAIGQTITRLRIPQGSTLDAARTRVRAQPGGEDADLNHFFRTSNDAAAKVDCDHDNCPQQALIRWQEKGGCRALLPIGVIDTGVNPDHEILAKSRIDLTRIADPTLDPSAAVHGTAIVSLLVGAEGSRVPGLLPEADVMAVDVFSRTSGDERADLPSVLAALDLLIQRDIRVINLSLAGPENAVLAAVLDSVVLADRTVLVAAAGNAGLSAPPAWPAAHPGVIAVTAVDARGRVYRNAQRGDHIDLAAPGVGLLAATSIRGARGKTGTSYAVPFVTAAATLLLSQDPEMGATEVAARLKAGARDLGAEGPDDIFGAGLMDASTICTPMQPMME